MMKEHISYNAEAHIRLFVERLTKIQAENEQLKVELNQQM